MCPEAGALRLLTSPSTRTSSSSGRTARASRTSDVKSLTEYGCWVMRLASRAFARDVAEHAVDELRRLLARVGLSQLHGFVDDHRHRRHPLVQQLVRAEPQHRALHLPQIGERPVLACILDRRIDDADV